MAVNIKLGDDTLTNVHTLKIQDADHQGQYINFVEGSDTNPLYLDTSSVTPTISQAGKFVVDSITSKMYTVSQGTANTWNLGGNSIPNSANLTKMAYGNGKFVAVGHNLSYYSEDGINWNEGIFTGLSDSDSVVSITFVGNKFLLGAQDSSKVYFYVYSSEDGHRWAKISEIYNNSDNSTGWTSIMYDDGICYVALGTYWNTGYSSKAYLYKSLDRGLTWALINNDEAGYYLGEGVYQNGILNILYHGYGAGALVTRILKSVDGGTTLLDRAVSTGYANSITYGNGRYVMVGKAGMAYYSTDNCDTFTAMTGLDTSVDYNSVVYANDKFVAVGNSGKAFYSTDGETWVTMEGLNTLYNYNAVTYGNEIVCVGNSGRSYYTVPANTYVYNELVYK